jgi:hypothetical protein
MNKDEALNGLKHLETIASQLKTYSDQGQYLNIPSHLSAGNCWWMAKEIENVINACRQALDLSEKQYTFPDKPKVAKCDLKQPAQEHNFCSRCGKRASKDLNQIHTCTPPQALEQPAWQGLTDDEIGQIIVNSKSLLAIDFYRAIEQALKEKNHG